MSTPVADFLDVALPTVFAVYLVSVFGYLALQVYFAERVRRRPGAAAEPGPTPSVDVIIPCYNENPSVLSACLSSLAAQDYPGPLQVHVIDDGSANRAELDPVYEDFGDRPGFRVIRLPENRGKRYAQVEAFTDTRGEIVVAVDSDTLIAPNGIREIVHAMRDRRVGAVMGEMLAANARTNLLTRLIDLRYWYACNQERAAQAGFGAVLCCSGPFSAYRRTVLEQVLDDYLNQTFRGRPSTYGEDRYLTNLVLRAGWRTSYAPEAKAVTIAPERVRPFLLQQLRWNRCTYRDTIGIVSELPARGAYLLLDVFMQVCAPAMLALSVGLGVLRGLVVGTAGLPWYGLGLVLVALAYCGYGMVRTRSIRFAGFALYGLLHLVVLIPVRVRALLTLSDDRWGERAVSLQRSEV